MSLPKVITIKRGRKPAPTIYNMLVSALDRVDEVIIERGLNGGYIVSAGASTGVEEDDLSAAIRSAIGGDF